MTFKVYYLDDEEMLCENFSDYFTTENVVVTTFIDPVRAIEVIKNNPPDLFFVDYRLPGTTGDEVAKTLDPKIPKFLITGDISVKTDYKFIHVISKPYQETFITDLISKYLLSKKSF